jgi:hypothetical protein
LSGRDGFGTLSPSCGSCSAGFGEFLEVFFTIFSAPDAGPSVRSVVQRDAWPALVTDVSGAEKGVSTRRVTSAFGVSDVGSC